MVLNGKADGIRPLLKKYAIQNYFLFDMLEPEKDVNTEKELAFYGSSKKVGDGH